MQEYADPVIDWLDAGRGILDQRFFRDVSTTAPFRQFGLLKCHQSCTQLPNGSYTKDLSIVEEDLARVCLVDNSPISYRINEGVCSACIRPQMLAYVVPTRKWHTHRRLDP